MMSFFYMIQKATLKKLTVKGCKATESHVQKLGKKLPWFLKGWGQLDQGAFPPPARGHSLLRSAGASDRPVEQREHFG